MKRGRKFLSAILVAAITLSMPGFSWTGGTTKEVKAAEKYKVVCVGGSTTFQEYPNYLQNVLGSEYQVINRGQNSTTATYIESLDKNDVNASEPDGIFDGKSYRVTSTFQYALEDNPDCVVIMIGGNDAKTNNWEKVQAATGKTPEEKYEEDYRWLINQFRNLPNHPDVIVATTGWAKNDGLFTIVNKYVDIVVPIQKKVAGDMGLEMVDINSITKGRDDIYTDGIHYNTTGYQLLADSIAPTVEKLSSASNCNLQITEIKTDRTYAVGEEVKFLVTIKNTGTAATRSNVKHGVPVFVDGVCVNWCDLYFGSLAPGEEKTVEMNSGPNGKPTWTVTEGTHTISAIVDDTQFIRESNEEDNEKTVTMTFSTTGSSENPSEPEYAAEDGQPALMEVFDRPAEGTNWYDEMYPMGNGNIGASVYGGVEVDSILINEKTLWSGGAQEYSTSISDFEYTGGLAAPGELLSSYAQRAQNAWKQARINLQAAVNTHSANGNENYNIPQSVTDTINQMKGNKSNFGSYQELGDINIIEPDYIEPSITRIYADKEHREGASASEASASLFDGNINTKYYADAVGGGNVAPFTIEWDYSMPKAIDSYTFTTGNDAEGRDPIAWTLYASTQTSGENYVQIDQRTDSAEKSRHYSTTYFVNTPGNYLRYRLVVTQVRDGGQMQLSEIAINAEAKKMDYSNYKRILSLDTAIANVSYTSGSKKYNREYFVSNPDNVMAIKLDASGSSFSKFFRITTEQKTKEISAQVLSDGSGVLSITGQPTPDSGFLNKTGFDKALYYAMKVKIIPTDGSITQVDDGIQVDNATSIVLIMSAGTNYKLSKSESYTDFFTGVDPMIAVTANVDNATVKGYEALKAAHTADYKNLYDRVKLQLEYASVPDKTTEQLIAGYENTNTDAEDRYLETLYYQFGRYLLIASSRENSLLPANLQGIWADGLTPPWSADYHTNINLQMNYWLSESTNLSETHEPVLEYVESLVEKGKQGVNTVFGTNESGKEIRGWTIWHENNPWGNIGPAVSDAFYAPEDGAWMCRDIWDRYEYTMDKEYLEDNYQTLKEAALFWVDTLWIDTRDNTLVVNPSYSPEHGPYSLGATEAQSIVWGIFDEVIRASEILGVNDSEVEEIRNAKSRLSGLKIGSAGQLQEWKDDTQLDITGDYGHRHVNHLYGLHPGDQIVAGRSEEDDKYIEAAKVTLNTRGDGGTGWSKAWKINFWARLLDGEHAQTMVKQILKESTITNLLDEHPPFQIDGNFGATSGMTEMLLQSQGGIIKLLPAISNEWSSGQVTGLKARGNVEVGMKWFGNTLNGATLRTLADGTITVSAPGIANMSITRAGQSVAVEKVDNETIRINAVKGAVYVVGESFGNIEENVEEEPTEKPTEEPTTDNVTEGTTGYDLIITNITTTPVVPKVGDEVYFNITVKNAGNTAVPTGEVVGIGVVVDDETDYCWSDQYTTGLAPGEVITVTTNAGTTGVGYWKAVAGTHTVKAHVDDVNRFPNETDENNNIFTTTFSVTEGHNLTTSNDVDITGYQISTSIGGFRVIGSVTETINNSKVQKWGLVYALSEVNGNDYKISESDMYVGNDNSHVTDFESTAAGTIVLPNGDEDKTYFVQTMKFASYSAMEYNAKYKVRAYAVMENGDYIYGDVYNYSIYKISDYLYQNGGMSNKSSHDYLYDKILSVVDSSYKKIEFDISKMLYR